MDRDTLYQQAQIACRSGGSSRGMSFYQDACQCGMRAHLRDKKRRANTWEAGDPEMAVNEGPLVTGSVYHRLHELWRSTEQSTDFDYIDPIDNKSIMSAVELFAGWKSQWERDFWGTMVAVEKDLPSTVDGLLAVQTTMGMAVTAKVDMCVDIKPEDLERVQVRCPDIQTPGRYLVDWKTAASKYPEQYYKESVQALWYPVAWEMEPETGDAPVLGIIFDIIIKPRWNAKDRSFNRDKFHAIMVPTMPNAHDSLQGMLAQADANLKRAEEHGQGNRAECIKFGFSDVQVCPFYGTECIP